MFAPNFEIHGSATKELSVPPDEDSDILSFLLRATHAGEGRRINLEIRTSENKHVGTLPFQTTVGNVSRKEVATLSLDVEVAEDNPRFKFTWPSKAVSTFIAGVTFLVFFGLIFPAIQLPKKGSSSQHQREQSSANRIGFSELCGIRN